MSAQKIINDWKAGTFKPVYWLEGEEEYYIDKIVEYAENKILTGSESEFNLSIFYGKDTNIQDVVLACKRYPMFSERQVIIYKEAQQAKDIEKLEPYVEHPIPTTVLIISYKNKKIDGRTKFCRVLKEKGEFLSTKKLYDNQLPTWTEELVTDKGFKISPKALAVLVDHVGNDLSRMENEVEKVAVNLGTRKQITEEDIEEFIGISKEFNVFELQAALAQKDMAKSIRIIQYFEHNPKAAPFQLLIPSLYAYFGKVFMALGTNSSDEKYVAAAIGVTPFFVKNYIKTARLYGYKGVEKALLLLHQYNLKSIGVNSAAQQDGSLLKEMIIKMIKD